GGAPLRAGVRVQGGGGGPPVLGAGARNGARRVACVCAAFNLRRLRALGVEARVAPCRGGGCCGGAIRRDARRGSGGVVAAPMRRPNETAGHAHRSAAPNRSGDDAPAPADRSPGSRSSVANPKSVTKFGGGSTTLAALLLLGIVPTIPR